ncbi:MAG: penicillin-binding protein 2 [Coriobacteriaceae bacterium]|uniref:peptidoglycan D,D-transpeptidase FtsI family protein n=1 Tax=Tractidigestivibacter sp. TaxID=2847320 RepID=UPI002A91F269|nr:penicillin-binding protein 2 [Tractidigestivibacter sp.]MCI6275015.1 penicillin-binding protein 2 [Coriobacteriaceae bacterium]MCI6547966.1 penicillin-binding protein 2 [Coriobacteriaceae bacterium]MDY5271597.1 penicillin-binding protein 2 [Tractidigestivibacter sp.]
MPEASYDEASRARYRSRASRPGGSGPGGFDNGTRMILAVLLAAFVIVAARLVWLQVVDAPGLSGAAEQHRTNVITLHAKRGTIYDRNGNVLAMSVDCKTIYCNPKEIADPSGVARILAANLGGSASDYSPALTTDSTFSYVERQVDTDVADTIKRQLSDAKLAGVYYLDDTKRVYPYGDVASQVLGVVGTDGDGLTGLEYYYNDALSGTDGQMIVETGLTGTPIAGGTSQVTEAKNGQDLVLSIDIDIQEKAEEVISQAVGDYDADSGSVMVTNPKTGEIYAACSTPLARLSDLANTSSEALTLKPVTASYEPGSMFKILTVAIGVENGLFNSESVYNVPLRILAGDDWVTDDEPRGGAEAMTVRTMLVRSSNVGVSLLSQEVIGGERFAKGVDGFGIGHATGIDYPGESEGIVTGYEDYTGATLGAMAFGQALAVPMVQIVRAFAIVANDGVPTTPHFLISKAGEEVDWPSGDRVVSKATADEVTDMMTSVMTDGTGRRGQVGGYTIAGKTGTGEQASESGGYQAGKYVASLCGFANAGDPEVLVYVGLNGTPHLALSSAAPTFKEIMEAAVTDLGIAPDASATTTSTPN